MSESPTSERSSEGRSTPNEKLQIRLVPYQPPRLSGGSELFNPNASIGSHLDNVEIHSADDSPCTASPPSSASTIAGPSRASAGKRRSSSIGPNELLDTGSPSIEAPPRGRFRSQSLSQSLKDLTSPPSPELPPVPTIPAAAAAVPTSPVQRRPKRFIDINLNSDNKTFSLVPLNRTSRTNSVVSTRTDSNPHYSVASSSSYKQNSSSIFSEDRPSSPLTTLAEDSASVTASSITPSIPEEDDSSGYPWKYRVAGGLRKVSQLSDVTDVTDTTPTRLAFLEEDPVASGKIVVEEERIAAFTLNSKKSFQSNKTGNTVSDRTNYKTYAQSSSGPETVRGSMASDFDTSSLFPGEPNYVVYDGASTSNQSRPHSDSDVVETPNYVVHGHRRTQSDGTDISHAPSEYSRDSMVVAPLRPMRSGRLHSSSTIPSTRSLEHMRTGSLTSVSGPAFNQDAEPSAPAGVSTQVDLEGRHSRSQSTASQGVHRRNTSRTQPWGTALSTVFSESERSDPSTRSISRLSGNARSSVFTLNQLRQTGSFSTFGVEETLAMASHSRNGSVDRPQPVYGRETPFSTARLVRDHDEDGDGLADLESMNRLPSRARGLSMASDHSGARNHRSRSRSNSRNNSISYSSVIPAWARVYYGSGERRFLAAQPSNESMFSQFTSSLHRDSSHSRSPSYEQYTGEIINPRRRPREMQRRASESDSMDIRPNPYIPTNHGVKKQTSSVWSPHLQTDRRASRYSIWSPPSLAESADFGIWKRNLQLVLFVLGFICPFTWIIGAILPIPPKVEREMSEHAYSTGHLDLRMEARQQRLYINAERLHERAKWWRNVNRRMSIIGALIICLCVVLIVVGVTQQWHS
ncbi:hypothetical protein V8C35DRAFT_100701 [Trichoderma chlorosporum]